MDFKIIQKPAFAVIGKLGSTADGEGFIGGLWQAANDGFGEIMSLAKREENGAFAGFWGLMSDESGAFHPWEDDFTRGLYLAGAEVEDDAAAPPGWVKWTAPASEYVVAPGGPEAFAETLKAMEEKGLSLAGAVYDFTDPATGENYQYFPIRRL